MQDRHLKLAGALDIDFFDSCMEIIDDSNRQAATCRR